MMILTSSSGANSLPSSITYSLCLLSHTFFAYSFVPPIFKKILLGRKTKKEKVETFVADVTVCIKKFYKIKSQGK